MALRFKNKEVMFILPDTRESKFDQVELFDKEGNPTGKTQSVAKKVKTVEREENPEEVGRRKAKHDRNRKKDYVKKRVREYPGFGEFAAMMFELAEDKVLRGEALLPLEFAWYEKCRAVKEQNPKPE